jgi:hypothetical protein
MGDERGAWNANELGGERWTEREDVVDNDIGLKLAH